MARTFDEIVAHIERRDRGPLLRGWRRAVVGAAAAALAVGALAETIGLLLGLGQAVPGVGPAQGARFGWAMFYAAHHSAFELTTASLGLPEHAGVVLKLPAGFPVTATVALAIVGLTAVAATILYRAGRGIGDEVGGSLLRRAIHGAKVAVPYAVIAEAASWPLRFTLQLPHTSTFSVHPEHVAAFFWPFGIAAAAGFAGGLSSSPEGLWGSEWWESRAWPDRWRAALAGGRTMFLTALALSIVGLCALAVVHPTDAATYLRGVFAAGPVAGTGLLLLSIAMLPNAATWILQPAMGGCVQVGGGAGTALPPYCFVSYSNVLSHRVPGPFNMTWGFPAIGPAPRAYLAFLAVPAIAVILGAIRAVHVADAGRARQGLLVGGMAGLAFTAMLTALLALTTVTVRFEGPITSSAAGFLRYGPYPAYGFGLALAWGAVGGAAVGGIAAVVRRSRR